MKWFAAAVLPLMLTGCDGFFVDNNGSGSGGSKTNTGDYVYVANANLSQASVAAFSVSSSGTLAAISGSPYTLNFIPNALAVTPNNAYLYVAGNAGVYGYTIASNGSLTLIGAGSTAPIASVAISPDGNYLFALESTAQSNTTVTPTAYSVVLEEYQIGTGGALTLIAHPTYTTTSGVIIPLAVRVSPNQSFVTLALGSAGTVVFTLSSGTLSTNVQVLTQSTLSNDNDMAFDSNSAYLYIARSGVSSGLSAYSVASGTGALNLVGTASNSAPQPWSVVLDSTGKFAYVSNNLNANTISGYSITAGSTPVALSSSPYTAGSQPIAVAKDNSGKFILAINSGGAPDLEVYSFSSSAAGALVKADSASTGNDPVLPIAVAATH